METIAIMGILGLLGYSFAETSQEKLHDKDKTQEERANEMQNFKRTMPNSTNIYNSDRVNAVNDMMLDMASSNFNESSTPDMSGVLPPIYNSYSVTGDKNILDKTQPTYNVTWNTLSDVNNVNRRADVIGQKLPPQPVVAERPMFQTKYDQISQLNQQEMASDNFSRFEVSGKSNQEFSLLTGQSLDREHANMVPFFGSNVKQNVEAFKNTAKLDNYTGNTSHFEHKREVGKMFEQFKEDIHGSPLFTDKVETDRYIPSKFHQGEKPFYEEKISAPVSFTYENPVTKASADFKIIDDLRVASKPQISYTAPLKIGQYGKVRGVEGIVQKNKVNMDFELGHERLFTSVGAVTATTAPENYKNMPVTSRQAQNIEYYGGAVDKQGLRTTSRIKIDNSNELFGNTDALFNEPSRQQLDADYARNIGSMVSDVNDYGKDGINLPELERETTNTMHVINANKSGAGNRVKLQDNAKNTTKETTLHQDNSGNIKTLFDKGKTFAYDIGVLGNEVKTTQKETLVENKYKGAPQRKDQMGYAIANYDAKTTNKETTHTDYNGHASKQTGKSTTVYSTYQDPVKIRNAVHAVGYTGVSKGFDEEMSRDNFNNAEISETKEKALMGARPSGAHNHNYAGGVNVLGNVKLTQNMLLKEERNMHVENVSNITQLPPSVSQIGALQTRNKTSEVESRRVTNQFADLIGGQLKDNPYYNLN
jgi:hypothetical protein